MSTDLRNFAARARPGVEPLEGKVVRVEPIVDDRRFAELAQSLVAEGNDSLWTYLGYGPFADEAAFLAFAKSTYLAGDMVFHAVVPASSGRAEGVLALMRIDEKNGVVEIGHICLGVGLQRTRAVTEAYRLVFGRVFDELGYRRLEWKCDSGNAPSRRAAERLGFTYEGIFRQHMVIKGRNRDTAWFAILDHEWPAIRAAFDGYLSEGNYDGRGRQIRPLADFF